MLSDIKKMYVTGEILCDIKCLQMKNFAQHKNIACRKHDAWHEKYNVTFVYRFQCWNLVPAGVIFRRKAYESLLYHYHHCTKITIYQPRNTMYSSQRADQYVMLEECGVTILASDLSITIGCSRCLIPCPWFMLMVIYSLTLSIFQMWKSSLN